MHEYLNDHSVSLQSGDLLNILKPGEMAHNLETQIQFCVHWYLFRKILLMINIGPMMACCQTGDTPLPEPM